MSKSIKPDAANSNLLLEKDKFGRPSEKNLRLAVIGIMAAMAHVDDDFFHGEYHEIVRIAVKEFDITTDEARELLNHANSLISDSNAASSFIDLINKLYDAEQKQTVYSMVQQVALSDNKLHSHEEEFEAFLKTVLNCK